MCDNVYLDIIVSIIDLISSIVILIGGLMGISVLNKFKEKQFNARFDFFARLKVQLKIMEGLFTNDIYKDIIINRFYIKKNRTILIDARLAIESQIIHEVSEVASSTLKYLMDENNQMPASKDWINEMNMLIEFLEDCKLIDNQDFYKWIEKDIDLEIAYYEKHSENLKNIIGNIEIEQNKIIKRIFDKTHD